VVGEVVVEAVVLLGTDLVVGMATVVVVAVTVVMVVAAATVVEVVVEAEFFFEEVQLAAPTLSRAITSTILATVFGCL
jgi:hypothetical protein